jgi:hypothetical protein
VKGVVALDEAFAALRAGLERFDARVGPELVR